MSMCFVVEKKNVNEVLDGFIARVDKDKIYIPFYDHRTPEYISREGTRIGDFISGGGIGTFERYTDEELSELKRVYIESAVLRDE